MVNVTTIFLEPNKSGVETAAKALRDGALVAFPTETVYGLGADARDGRAVAQIFAAKGRPAFNPLIIHVATLEVAKALKINRITVRRHLSRARTRLQKLLQGEK